MSSHLQLGWTQSTDSDLINKICSKEGAAAQGGVGQANFI